MGKKIILIIIFLILIGGLVIFAARDSGKNEIHSADNRTTEETNLIQGENEEMKDSLGPFEKISVWQSNDKNYVVGFERDGGYWVRVAEIEYGPYDLSGQQDSLFAEAGEAGWLFSYFREGNFFLNINGKEHGPYESYDADGGDKYYLDNFIFDDNFGYSFKKDGGYYFNINGKEFGPYESAQNLAISRSGKWIASYTRGGKYYVNSDGRESDPYEIDQDNPIADLEISDEVYIFNRQGDGKYFVNVSGKEFGPFELTDSAYALSTNGNNYLFNYQKGDRWYVNANGKEYGPYEAEAEPGLLTSSNDNWGFYYTKGDKDIVVISGKEYGPFDSLGAYAIDQLELSPGHFGFSYSGTKTDSADENDVSYVALDDKNYGPFDFSLLAIAGDNWMITYLKGNSWYVIANGETFGPFQYQKMVTDMAGVQVSGRDILEPGANEDGWMFDFQKEEGGKWYVNANGKELGPYDSIGDNSAQFALDDSTYAFSYSQDGKWYFKRGKNN